MAIARTKLTGWTFWESLGSPKKVVAPMVDQSELAWRILSRRYGADLCYTPMFHARLFAEEPKYRNEMWQTDSTDRPLFVQFCANDPDHLLRAAKLVETQCDAVDLNLGCPQHIAKRGRYGSFLMEEWDLIHRMVKNLAENLSIPVTVKIRVFPDVEKTIAYAKMIESAGASVLTVHGRLREQKGHKTGLADWEQIRRVKETLSIPVIANGNILYAEDIDLCLASTGADAVMTAEGNLYDPSGIFTGKHLPVWVIGEEVTAQPCHVRAQYLDIVKDNPKSATTAMIRGHLFKIWKPW
ncbi:dihydrouridine synthase [Gonapodya prolifera JEL478]|uniref:tRNA-dihydrouridine(16/17) synthase [NAD(P)(+)] n=1 Tax=Gonapodya prolifera (strain JEL478) TaxID=1344416 RepID=A0A139AEX6_GONPJ|nr:dihydrouridine synthase [Gonapodya prolifera JEL478]|eukprot:KXS14985.1 dihydrouridine synthase [Gonapodya prolifera JEL478]